jgi:hypothetical protein
MMAEGLGSKPVVTVRLSSARTFTDLEYIHLELIKYNLKSKLQFIVIFLELINLMSLMDLFFFFKLLPLLNPFRVARANPTAAQKTPRLASLA